MADCFIVSAVRTPIGRFGGALKSFSAVELAANVMQAALERASIPPDALDLVVFGNVLRAGQGQLVPRQAAIKAGIPLTVDSVAVDMVCSSGMMSIMQGAALIRAGEADLVLTGGTESMTNAGFYLSGRARWGYKFLGGAPEQLEDVMVRDGLSDPMTGEAMGVQAERLAAESGVTRDELDYWAVQSHLRAAKANREGGFAQEIVPVTYREGKETRQLDRDEGVREDTSAEKLASLKSAFIPDGLLTAGNSSQISDGAAALMLASAAAVERYGLEPIARIGAGTWAAGETWRFPEAPIPAVRKLMDRTGLGVSDIDLWENNEAFSLNNILYTRLLGIPGDTLNVHGGAVALGHPIGASGARILVTLVHAMRQRNRSCGLASICHGTGGSTALLVEL